MFITFVPGGAVGWFGTAAGAASFGLLSPKWKLRLVAVGLIAVCGWFGWVGYRHGLQYQEWLKQHDPL